MFELYVVDQLQNEKKRITISHYITSDGKKYIFDNQLNYIDFNPLKKYINKTFKLFRNGKFESNCKLLNVKNVIDDKDNELLAIEYVKVN